MRIIDSLKTLCKLAAILLLISSMPSAAASRTWSAASPNGKCVITLGLDAQGRLAYHAAYGGKPAILDSPLGLRTDSQDFSQGLKFMSAGKTESYRERYELFSGNVVKVDSALRRQRVIFSNPNQAALAIDLAASDDGVAFRYVLPGSDTNLQVLQSEFTGFAVPATSQAWLEPYHAAGPYTPAYEDFFFRVKPGDPPPDSRSRARGWCFPALFHADASSPWILLTESGTEEQFCACHLAPDSTGGLYKIAFPFADEATKGHINQFGPEPRSADPWTMPWRVIVLGKSAGDIAMATLVTDLALPSEIRDTSWIHPGRASWAWWSYPDAPATVERFNEFTDFAAKMGWEYTLFDAGWRRSWLPDLASRAEKQNVKPLAWLHAGDFYDPQRRARRLDDLAAAGIAGVKVDFWCSDRQEAIAAMMGLFRDAAERKLLVNLHGCTIPRGWQRTWPNFMTAEAVLGAESYFYEARYPGKAAELNTILPFTRNAIGPMDSTPVAGTIRKYPRLTTAAHELATAIILNSGIIHYADKPEFFDSLPVEARAVFRDAPARWDETRCLVGDPGEIVVFARRAGDSWFIAGLNGTSASRDVDLNLQPFKDFQKRVLISEASDALKSVIALPQTADSHWRHDLPPRGGFILRMDK